MNGTYFVERKNEGRKASQKLEFEQTLVYAQKPRIKMPLKNSISGPFGPCDQVRDGWYQGCKEVGAGAGALPGGGQPAAEEESHVWFGSGTKQPPSPSKKRMYREIFKVFLWMCREKITS